MFTAGMIIGVASIALLGVALWRDGAPTGCCSQCGCYPSCCDCVIPTENGSQMQGADNE